MSLIKEINKRRTFAIISHPDAGKTTLTEKFLLYGGAVQLAGSVTARKNQRKSTSDWMELERKRGISISSTVLQFDYNGYIINLLDTPGHEDFSEDTYRVLTAVDAVVMVIDAAKGIETQTRKLFAVCSKRGIPIFTFVNKLDRPTREPIELLDEIESILGIGAYPMNYPLGTGLYFKGVYDRMKKEIHFFEKTAGGLFKAPVAIMGIADPIVKEKMSSAAFAQLIEDLEMLEHAGESFDQNKILTGKLTPVFFGSAMNNFGVQLLLDSFLKYAVPPAAHISTTGIIQPEDKVFSGFVFKIQANMDPKHRDRIAFMRICSGKFSRDMQAFHSVSGKKIRLSNSQKMFGQERETVNEAFPGDIIGFVGNGGFGIGDTISEDINIIYDEIPRFAPEHFVFLHNPNPSNYKKFRDGLDQLLQEGVIQAFYLKNSHQKVAVLGAVGPLQFEVVQYRLLDEYGAESRIENTNWRLMRWVSPDLENRESEFVLPAGAAWALDTKDRSIILFTSEWSLNYFKEKDSKVILSDIPFKEEKIVI